MDSGGIPKITGADFGTEEFCAGDPITESLAYLIRNHKSILMQPKPLNIWDWTVLATDIP